MFWLNMLYSNLSWFKLIPSLYIDFGFLYGLIQKNKFPIKLVIKKVIPMKKSAGIPLMMNTVHISIDLMYYIICLVHSSASGAWILLSVTRSSIGRVVAIIAMNPWRMTDRWSCIAKKFVKHLMYIIKAIYIDITRQKFLNTILFGLYSSPKNFEGAHYLRKFFIM